MSLYTQDSFLAIETILRKYGPAILADSDQKEEPKPRKTIQKYRKPIGQEIIDKMRKDRLAGFSIANVALRNKVDWRTAWKFTKDSQPKLTSS